MSTLTKKFLYALEAKGVDICDDMTILANGDGHFDMYLGDGTAATSLVKDVEFVEHDFDDGAGAVHAMKISRAFGDVIYKPLKGINDLLSTDISGELSNLTEVANNIALIQTEVTAAIDAQEIARLQDVQNLESSFDNFIQAMAAQLVTLTEAMYSYADAADVAILTQAQTELTLFASDHEGLMGRDYATGTIDFNQLAGSQTVSIVIASGDSERINPDRWIIRAHRKDGDGKLYNDSIAHTITAGSDELVVVLDGASCGDNLYQSDVVCVTAVYCGPRDVDGGVDTLSNPGSASMPTYDTTNVLSATLGDSDGTDPKIS